MVGDLEWDNVGFEARIVQAMKDVPVRMISTAESNYNVSLLVKSADEESAAGVKRSFIQQLNNMRAAYSRLPFLIYI